MFDHVGVNRLIGPNLSVILQIYNRMLMLVATFYESKHIKIFAMQTELKKEKRKRRVLNKIAANLEHDWSKRHLTE